jgi:hypothetical protein
MAVCPIPSAKLSRRRNCSSATAMLPYAYPYQPRAQAVADCFGSCRSRRPIGRILTRLPLADRPQVPYDPLVIGCYRRVGHGLLGKSACLG